MSGAAAFDGEVEVVEAGFKIFCKERKNIKSMHQGNEKLLFSKRFEVQFTCGLSEERLLAMRSNITLEVEDGILDLGEGAASLESSPETLVGTVLFEISFFCFFFEAVGKFPPALGSSPVVFDFRFFGVVGGSLLV